MKKLLSILSVILSLSVVHGQITFQKTFGGTGSDNAVCIKQTNDSGYMILGNTSSFNSGYYDMILIKTDKNYNVQWSKIYGDGPQTGLNYGYEIIQTTDTGYVISACSNTDGVIIKSDKLGNIQWSYKLDSVYYDGLGSIIQAQDGNIIALGSGQQTTSDLHDFFLIKIDMNGNLLWTKSYGGSEDDFGYKIIEMANGDLIMTGTTKSYGAGGADVYLVKTDSAGNLLLTKTYGTSADEYAFDIKYTSDGSFIMSGGTSSGFIYLIKIDSACALQWSKTYHGTGNFIEDYGMEVIESTSGGFAVACSTFTFQYATLLRLDNTGNLLWAKGYGDSTGQNDFYSLLQTSDNGYLLSGATTLNNPSGDIFLVKTDSNGTSGCNEQNLFPIVANLTVITGSGGSSSSYGTATACSTITVIPSLTINTPCLTFSLNDFYKKSSFKIYPNPFSSSTTLQTDNLFRNATLTVDNCFGQTVKQIKNILGQTVILHRDNLPSGLYFLQLTQENKIIAIEKLVITD